VPWQVPRSNDCYQRPLIAVAAAAAAAGPSVVSKYGAYVWPQSQHGRCGDDYTRAVKKYEAPFDSYNPGESLPCRAVLQQAGIFAVGPPASTSVPVS
jgi:hypothetical protein